MSSRRRDGASPLARALLLPPLVCMACGGSTDAPRPDGTFPPGIPGYLEAPAGGGGYSASTPLDCNGRSDIELEMIQDFEFGAAGGWYTSNDVCSVCQDFVNAIDALLPDVLAQQQRIAGTLAENLDPAEVAALEASEAELAELEQNLEGCTPACNAAQTSPYYFDNPPVAEAIPQGRCGSRFAMHVQGGPFLNWGGNMGFSFSPLKNVTTVDFVDPDTDQVRPAEDLQGLSFWARLGDTASNSNLNVQVAEMHTSQNYTGGPDGGPICNPNITEDNSEEGCDQFGATAQLRQQWQQFVLPFAEMRQAGWGRRAEFFDLQGLMSLTIFYAQGSWDFWIDDLAFYRRKQ